MLEKYEIDFEGSYRKIRKGICRFLKVHDLKIDYRQKRGDSWEKRLIGLVDRFEELLEPMGFHCMMHKDEYEPILDAAVYVCTDAMDYIVGEIYVRPAETLPPEESMLFKRFISFFSRETNIGLGLDSESYFLEAQADWWGGEYEDVDRLDEDEKACYQHNVEVIQNYKTGRYKQLFDEIKSFKEDGVQLEKDLEAYLKKYDGVAKKQDEVRLMANCLDGIEVARHINIFDWVENPDCDGIYDDDNYYNATSLMNFILYSEHDGFGEAILDSINNAGDECIGWCSFLKITNEKNFKVRQEYFEESINWVPRFRKWLDENYKAAEKFDTDEHIERPDEG